MLENCRGPRPTIPGSGRLLENGARGLPSLAHCVPVWVPLSSTQGYLPTLTQRSHQGLQARAGGRKLVALSQNDIRTHTRTHTHSEQTKGRRTR